MGSACFQAPDTMAENESLDIGHPRGQRWAVVCDAVRKGKPADKVAKQVHRKVTQGLRKALKQLAEKGVSLEVLLAHRNSPSSLRELLKRSEGHDYANLFLQAALAEKGRDTEAVLNSFVGGSWDIVSDQIAQAVSGSERWASVADLQRYLDEVRHQVEPNLHQIARRLANDPSSMPTCRPLRGSEKVDATAEMMEMSLLPVQNPR